MATKSFENFINETGLTPEEAYRILHDMNDAEFVKKVKEWAEIALKGEDESAISYFVRYRIFGEEFDKVIHSELQRRITVSLEEGHLKIDRVSFTPNATLIAESEFKNGFFDVIMNCCHVIPAGTSVKDVISELEGDANFSASEDFYFELCEDGVTIEADIYHSCKNRWALRIDSDFIVSESSYYKIAETSPKTHKIGKFIAHRFIQLPGNMDILIRRKNGTGGYQMVV